MAKIWVLDTGLLVDTWLYPIASGGEERWRSNLLGRLRWCKSESAHQAFVAILGLRQVTTWCGALIEAGWVARRLLERTPHDDRLLWTLIQSADRELTSRGVRFDDVPITALDAELVDTHGPTDARLVALTTQLAFQHQDATLLTIDGPLAAWCLDHEVSCEQFDLARLTPR